MTTAQITALAEEIAARYNDGHFAPFPYERLVRGQRDVEILFAALDDDDVSGVIQHRDDIFSIIINTNKPVVRQNFTLGHELGHYFLHQDILRSEPGIIDGDAVLERPKILYREDEASSQRLEQEANTFAASLLMPARLVREAWQAVGDIQKMAHIFQVSVIAMSIRLTQLGLVA